MMAGVGVEERIVPGWMRALEVLTGVGAIILGIAVLAYQTVAILTLLLLLSWALLLFGVRQIAMGVAARWRPGGLRALSVVAGVLLLVLAFLVIAFPGLGFATLVVLLYVGLVIFGVAEISVGAGARFMRGWMRGYFIAIGVLDLILASLILIFPSLAQLTLVVILSLALLLSGIELAVSGVVGRFRVVGVGVVAPSQRGPVP